MKFGLWVAPNLVDPRTVGSLIMEEWLCKVDGKIFTQDVWGPENAPVGVCVGCTGYIAHLKEELAGMIKRFNVDELRWDDSGAPVGRCNRADHGHQAGDWLYAWQRGQYEIFEHLRAKFPHLIIELARGPNFGAARTVVANMGDNWTPGFGNVDYGFPNSFFDAWVSTPVEGNAATLDTLYRARMLSQFGFGTIHGTLAERVSLYPEPMLAAARRNIPVYKRYRHLLNEGCFHLRATTEKGPDAQWMVKQCVSPARDEAVVLAFRNGSSQDTVRLPVRGLEDRFSYELTFANTGDHKVVRGADLLRDGVPLALTQPDMSEVILFKTKS